MKKTLWTILTLMNLVLSAPAAMAAGGRSDGGGDICEDRIKVIRDDLKAWIQKGGSAGLILPEEISAQQYANQMLSAIDSAKIACIGPSDSGYPVAIEGTPKVCKFHKDWFSKQITCDFSKFLTMSESDQYVLIHHEFAGLSGFELPNKDDSHYEISNQISGYLAEQVVKKLVVKMSNGSGTLLPSDQLDLYKHAIIQSFRYSSRLSCDLISGGVNYGADETLSEGIARKAAIMIAVAQSAILDKTGPLPRFIFNGPFAWSSDDKGGYAYYKHVKEEVIVTVAADFKTVVSVQWTELRDDRQRDSGDLLHPVISSGFLPTSVTLCK
jgi:hypothetical protein